MSGRWIVAAAVLALTGTVQLAAQRPAAIPDSAAQRMHAALVELRDSLSRVMADVQSFRRDLQQVGAETVLGRAYRAQRSCIAAAAQLERAEAEFRPAAAAPPVATEARSFRGAMREFRAVLAQQCERGLNPEGAGERADTLRAWGPYRTSQLERAFARYTQAAHRLARAAGVRIEPRIPRR